MGKLNDGAIWFLDRLPRSSRPDLSPRQRKLREGVVGSCWRVAIVSMFASFIAQLIGTIAKNSGWSSFLITPVLAFFMICSVGIYIEKEATEATRRYTRWLIRLAPRRARMAAPYERQPPVASLPCAHDECLAQAGDRHTASCPSVPEGWFDK